MDKLYIIKVGGAVVEDESQLARLTDDFARLDGHKVLVHGGGRRATKVAEALGVESRIVQGRRVTSEGMLDVATMVYGGLVNKHIVALLQTRGVNAIGLTGADGGIIRSHRRPPVMMKTDGGTRQEVDFGLVGDIDKVDGDRLRLLLSQGMTPVIAPLTYDGDGGLLNTNADTMASEVAVAMAKSYGVTLVYAFEKSGVLRDHDDEDTVIPVINTGDYRALIDTGAVSGGMIPKIENAVACVVRGVSEVRITRFDKLAGGTLIRER